MAAPTATASSGLTDLSPSFPVKRLTNSWTAGIRVEPPTKMTLWMSFWVMLASFNAFLTGVSRRLIIGAINSSNFARVSSSFKCLGPFWSAVMKGILMSTFVLFDNSIFAFSHSSFKRCMAVASLFRLMPVDFLKLPITWFMMISSTSSPPKKLSPEVDFTSKIPSPNSKMETSNVPPPKSKTRIVWACCCLSRPYANDAAVGSLIIRKTFKPAISPAFLVAWRWESLKYAGTVMTAFITGWPR